MFTSTSLIKAIRLVLDVMACGANKYVYIQICGKVITISNDGLPFHLDFDEERQIWNYNRIFNHPLALGAIEFGLANEERLTLVQLVSEFMSVTVTDSEFCIEHNINFGHGIVVDEELISRYSDKPKDENCIKFSFNSSLFLMSFCQLSTDSINCIIEELAKVNKGKTFKFCYQPEPTYAETYTYISEDGINVKTKQEKIKSII